MPQASRKTGAVPEAVRRAVEKTVQSTLGTAGVSRGRAQELADDVLRRAEKGAVRAGRGVRGAGQKQREAASGVGDRVRDAIQELRAFGVGEDVSALRAEVEALRKQVQQLERDLKKHGSKPAKAKPKRGKGKPKQKTGTGKSSG